MSASDTYDPNLQSTSDYYDRIETMADVVEDRLDADPEADLPALVFREVDSSRMVMYTHEAINALKYGRERPEEWKHFVSEDDTWEAVVRAMAFSQTRVSLWEELDDRDIDD